ncbi:unnamed protein product [Rhizopus stolonifer]
MTTLTTHRFSVSTSSSLASRRKHNKKNLSLSLSNSSPVYSDIPKTASFIPKDQNIHAYPQPVQILPHLYLGSEKSAQDLEQLKSLSIQAILNVAVEVTHPDESMFQSMDDLLAQAIMPSPSLSKASTISTDSTTTEDYAAQAPLTIGYHKMNWEHNQENLVTELEKAVTMIEQARSAEQTILVHCQCGIARSATVVIAYVMKSLKLPMQEAYDYVKERSPVISPNLTLLFQLREYEQWILQQQKQKIKKSTHFSFKWKSKSLFYKK